MYLIFHDSCVFVLAWEEHGLPMNHQPLDWKEIWVPSLLVLLSYLCRILKGTGSQVLGSWNKEAKTNSVFGVWEAAVAAVAGWLPIKGTQCSCPISTLGHVLRVLRCAQVHVYTRHLHWTKRTQQNATKPTSAFWDTGGSRFIRIWTIQILRQFEVLCKLLSLWY